MARSSEFDLIRDCFSTGYPAASDLLLGIGDDCSLITPPADMELAQSIDTQVAGVHFPADAPPGLIAGRALRCATSDLAAMGAVPQGFHLALTLNNSEDWFLRDLAAGLRLTANTLNMPLLGGDTTYGEHLTITIAVQGWLPRGLGLRRDAARPGQDIWLTGKVGGAALTKHTPLTPPRVHAALLCGCGTCCPTWSQPEGRQTNPCGFPPWPTVLIYYLWTHEQMPIDQ